MTNRQTYILDKVREQLNSARMMLDDIMYHTDELSDTEHKKMREAYDNICSALDKM